MKHKKLLITCTVLFSVAVCLATFIMIWFWGDSYPDFDEFNKSLEIPGLDEGAVPQGICSYYSYIYDENGQKTGDGQNYFFISAYMKSGPSKIYVTGQKTGYIGYVTMKCRGEGAADGEGYIDYNGHAGGIATSCKRDEPGGTFWMVSDGTVFCMKGSSTQTAAEEIIATAKTGGTVRFGEKFSAGCKASFCYFFEDRTSNTNDKLYVGEFYHPSYSEFSTDESHHITTKSGETQYAMMFEYTSSTSTKYGVQLISNENVAEENRVPKINAAYSIPEKVQGFARVPNTSGSTGGRIVLSQSWGLANSSLLYYDYADVHATSNRTKYSSLKKYTGSSGEERGAGLRYEGITDKYGQPVYEDPDVYFIDSSLIKRAYSIPSMAEGLCVTNPPERDMYNMRIYVLFESGCYKYKLFVRQQLTNIFYFTPEEKTA